MQRTAHLSSLHVTIALLIGAAAQIGFTTPVTAAPDPTAPSPAAVIPGQLPKSRHDPANEERFLTLWRILHDPAGGYFSPEGLPYHAAETFVIEAPDYGHETTSETISYWIWLEAKYGHLTGDWSKLSGAWDLTEQYVIPTQADQPTNRFYNAGHPASYLAEYETPNQYPSQLRMDIPVGDDPIGNELKRTYGTPDVYGMHWLIDTDNWYGFGRRGDRAGRPTFMNTFQRGPMESVWATVPHPSWEGFNFGGPNGYLPIFTRDNNYSRQWRYTNAPDADARAIQAMFWAYEWASQNGQQEKVQVARAAKMGDYLRYALFDKYFKKIGARSDRDGGRGYESAHFLFSWYYAWGGAVDPNAGWAFRIGSSHNHAGYQNPMTAWALSQHAAFRPKSPKAAEDWKKSLARQMEFYRWLQSAEGGIAGGATNSWNGRYERPPEGTSTFHGMAYDWQPVYHDPPSNNWFGMQTWSMGRVAEFYYVTGDATAKAILDKWTAWAAAQVVLKADGGFAVPSTLKWSGQPDSWNADAPGANASLHVEVVDRSADIGVAGSLARTFLYYSAGGQRWGAPNPKPAALARQLLDRAWATCRDARGISSPEERPDYKRVFEQTVYVPDGFNGRMPNGDEIKPGVKFIDLRSRYRLDPAFPEVETAWRAQKAPTFRFHRFWAQVEMALAYAAAAELDTGESK